jgi:uncharacterized membrane protein
MNALLETLVGTAAAVGTGAVLAQGGNMMDGGSWGMGWMGGGYGGFWLPVLLVIVVVGAVVWGVKQKGK